MDLSKYSPKDAAIIKNYPDMSPYDLVHQKGLSQAAYRKLVEDRNMEKDEERKKEQEQQEENNEQEQPQDKSSASEERKSNAMQPDSIEPDTSQKQPYQPQLSPIKERPGSTKKVLNRGTGQVNEMAAKLADDLTRKYPNEYKIVE